MRSRGRPSTYFSVSTREEARREEALGDGFRGHGRDEHAGRLATTGAPVRGAPVEDAHEAHLPVDLRGALIPALRV